MNRWTSSALHEELALIYRAFPGVTVRTSQTEALWRRIEEAEALEFVQSIARKK